MYCFFFFSVTAPSEIYTLSLHDALPIFGIESRVALPAPAALGVPGDHGALDMGGEAGVVEHLHGVELVEVNGKEVEDRKSTRLNSSHRCISYAVFCLKKTNNRTKKSTTL